jgi:hypothetical protein
MARKMGAGAMTELATITDECVSFIEYRQAGATISENDYETIDYHLRRSRSQSKWLPELLREIDRLARLAAGWDSYGADPPSPDMILAARKLIEHLTESYLGLPRPTVVTATRSGSIQFEWGSDHDRYFELECVSPETAEYLFSERGLRLEIEGSTQFKTEQIDKVIGFILRASRRI